MSLNNILLNYLERQDGWIHSGELERVAKENKHLGSSATRQLRGLRRAGKVVKKKMPNVKGIYYKSAKKQVLKEYFVDGVKVGEKWV